MGVILARSGAETPSAGRLIRAKIDAGTAATLTGHSVHIMLRYYQVVTDGDRREAAERANLGVLVDSMASDPVDPDAARS